MRQYDQSQVRENEILSETAPWLFGLLIVECIISKLKRKKVYRLNDTINSISHGLIEQIFFSLTSKGVEFATYIYVYNRFRLFDVEETSIWLWIICLFGVDLGYYWFHRMAHEINIFWASHSVHHSSEDYNLSTALRQSAFQVYISWIFYIPLALIIPPPLFYLHKQFNALYQFFIHTQLVGKMGFLEYILNTPSHHRVHHGRNPKYIDKNYAGIFIIWDRLFGTFQEEIEEPVYGLVHPLQSWDVVEGQIGHAKYIIQKVKEKKSIKNKLEVLFKGPGWDEGKPRLGDIADIPEVDAKSVQKYDPQVDPEVSCYVLLHFIIVLVTSILLVSHRMQSYLLHVIISIFMVFSLFSFGAIFDKKEYSFHLELFRVTLLLLTESVCWFTYDDKFIFLWFHSNDINHIYFKLIKVVRMFYILSIIWLIKKGTSFTNKMLIINKEKGFDNNIQYKIIKKNTK